eukprot:109755_1
MAQVNNATNRLLTSNKSQNSSKRPRRNNHNQNKKRKHYKKWKTPPKKKQKANTKCGVCNVHESKYKCPNCRVTRYCSVACYKTHKADKEACIKPQKKLNYDQNEPVSVTGYTVSQKQLELLKNNDEIKLKLMNKKLKQIIESIDDSKRPQNKLETMMQSDKDFAEFVDSMLKSIGFRPTVDDTDDSVDRYYCHPDEDLELMNDNDKFKYLLRQMLTQNDVL